ncbi:N-formylglutamate deformylase [Lysobacter arvi]|uniref:N-formylglutamate deformylase n=1 Tax=Lysobacter arvi TaxID=3038776 RepID=A0ABU1CC52_9GAMM|nr:N-formylglutamate deformylase [Lysobacter arvi]MDR0182757.1 N-formylglutamate deformylase [Lysobacter arvi]
MNAPPDTDIFTLHRGTAPLLVSLPHDGSHIPEELAARMVPAARRAPDTDWHVSVLYDFARELGASIIVPRHSRYVVDLNRPPDDTSLYPGQNTTGLCPAVQFTGEPVYLDGQAPDEAEVALRVERYWRPYHEALIGEIERLRAQHGRMVLWEGHSIRGSNLPFLFEGRLPDLNLGTAGGASCSPALQQRLEAVLEGQIDYDYAVNGRFKGGYITRHYADVARGVEAVQLEVSQRNYMDEDSFAYDASKAAVLQAVIGNLLRAVLA